MDFEDESFVSYEVETVDPGYSLLIGTSLFCLLSNLLLPCFVSLGRRYEKRRIAQQSMHSTAEEDENQSPKQETAKDTSPTKLRTDAENVQGRKGARTHCDDAVVSTGHSSFVHGSVSATGPRDRAGIVFSLLDKLIMPPYPDDVDGSVLNRSAFSSVSSVVESSATSTTSTSRGKTSFLDAGFGTHCARSRGLRQRRRALMDVHQRRQDQCEEENADKEYRHVIVPGRTGADDREVSALTGAGQSDLPRPTDLHSEVSSHASSKYGVRARRTSHQRNESAISGNESALGAPSPSVMSRLDDHVITPGDAADADDPGHYILPKPGMEGDEEMEICCGKNAWWQPSMIVAGFDKIVALAECDHELKRIITLSIPFVLTALLLGINQTITVALVSQFIGTDAVVAFVLVDLLLGLTCQLFSGIVSTEATLCSQAVGAENYKLAGQYVQICAVTYTLCMIPNILAWSFLIDDVIAMFGFGPRIAEIGHSYAIVLLFQQLLYGVNYAYHGLLNVIDREKWSTFISVAEDTVGVLVTLAVVLSKETTLQEIGWIRLGVSVIFFVFNCWYTVYRGWMNKYLGGMIGSFALTNRKAVRAVLSTGLPVSLGYFIEYGEWEILTIFAAAMGPAEVAAWGLIGTIWTVFETLTNGIGNGGEVRCAYHLGAGDPGMARISAYKAVLLGVVAACFFTAILFIIGEDVAGWLSPDPTLQHLIADLLPLLGIGNIALTAGTVSWALVGSQGRYRLATLVAFVFSWGVTMPLAAFFTFGLNVNLQGITASVVIGYSVTGTVLIYILLRSDWERLSECVIELNEIDEDELDQFRPAAGNESSGSSAQAVESHITNEKI